MDRDVDRASRILELAATKADPREYIGAVLRGDREPRVEEVCAEANRYYRTNGVL